MAHTSKQEKISHLKWILASLELADLYERAPDVSYPSVIGPASAYWRNCSMVQEQTLIPQWLQQHTYTSHLLYIYTYKSSLAPNHVALAFHLHFVQLPTYACVHAYGTVVGHDALGINPVLVAAPGLVLRMG